VAVGEHPPLRAHPVFQGLTLPPLGAVGTSGAIVTGGGLVFISGGSTQLHALDSRSGAELSNFPLGGEGNANPMTYRTRNGRQFVVMAVTRARYENELVAFALPWR
jgi:quinoprotein glucose dehydrogenase